VTIRVNHDINKIRIVEGSGGSAKLIGPHRVAQMEC